MNMYIYSLIFNFVENELCLPSRLHKWTPLPLIVNIPPPYLCFIYENIGENR